MNKYSEVTNLISEENHDSHGAVIPPIYQNSLFTFDDWDAIDDALSSKEEHCIYSRGSNPTVQMVEKKIASLASGERALLFASGMGAISSAILSCVKSGDHIITIKYIYGPTNKFIKNYLGPRFNIDVTYVDGGSLHEFRDAVRKNTTLVYLESPSSVFFNQQDIEGVVGIAKPRGIKTIIDNTWATPVFQKPLPMGVDLEVHSCSKYLGGHSDIVAGVVIGNNESIQRIFSNEYELLGAKMAPFEAWLLLRSLRTLDIRMRQHQSNAFSVAKFLNAHPMVEKVYFPGLTDPENDKLSKRQMKGYSSVMSFTIKTDNLEKVKTFVNSLKLFKLGVSWGGHESLVYVPAISYSKELSSEQLEQMHISLRHIRLSIGLEMVEDLCNDLAQSFEKLGK